MEVILLSAIAIAIILFFIARNPEQNREALWGILVAGIVAAVVNIWIVATVDFTLLGATAKRVQTIVETILLVVWIGALFMTRPRPDHEDTG